MAFFRNPFVKNAPDPFMVREGEYYYLLATTGRDVTLARSKTLAGFAHCEKKALWTAVPGRENGRAVWAPELHRIDGTWWIYYAATDGAPANRRMFVLQHEGGPLWEGTWKERGRLVTRPDRWAIDGTVLEDGGTRYFVWSGWEGLEKHEKGNTQNLYIARMANPYTLEGERVLLSVPEYGWEQRTVEAFPDIRINEGPEALYTPSYLYILYSASFFKTPHYCLGALRIRRGLDPLKRENWEKFDHPLFAQAPGGAVCGVGHHSVLRSPDGSEDWIVYHGYDADPALPDAKRHAFAQRFTLDADEIPMFGEPWPVNIDLPAPSGEPKEEA